MPRFFIPALLFALLAVTTAGLSALPAQSPHHYLCRVLVTDDGLALLSAQRVEAPIPQRRAVGNGPLLATLHSPDGLLLHESRHHDPRLVRAPLSPEGHQTHALSLREQGVLLLRLPQAPPDARFRLFRLSGQTRKDADGAPGELLGELTLNLADAAGDAP